MTWAAILCAEGLLAGFAQAQYPATGGDGRYLTIGATPGMEPAMPGAPQPPRPATRPAGWPASYADPGGYSGAPQGYAPPDAHGRRAAPPPGPRVSRVPDRSPDLGAPQGPSRGPDLADARPFLGAHVVARVGKEVITVSDVLAQIPTIVDRNRGTMSDEVLESQKEALIRDMTRAIEEAFARQNGPEEQLVIQSEQLRAQMLAQMLKNQIQTLLVFLDAQRNLPEEGLPEVRRQIDDGFEKQVVPDLMKRAGAGSRRELEEFLRSRGTSLEREKRTFFQQTLAHQWVRQYVNPKEEITHEQMLAYYRSHLAEFDQPAQTVWEQLCVQFVDQPSHEEAHTAIANMGNRVVAGEPFADVAKDASQGPTAAEGGRRVWPDQRHLSEELERAIHGLPVGELSPILRDWRGLHVIRVVERTPAGRIPFEKAQEEIREKIREERVQKQIDQYIGELKRRTSVWTVLDPRSPEQLATPAVQRP